LLAPASKLTAEEENYCLAMESWSADTALILELEQTNQDLKLLW